MGTFRRVQGLALLSFFGAASTAAAGSGNSMPDNVGAPYHSYDQPRLLPVPHRLVDDVREANGRFKDVSVAVVEGYTPLPCASGIQGGAMGVLYINGKYLKDGVIDLKQPEAVMYEPTADGKMALIAVEYMTLKGPASLEGHLFNFTNSPNRYGLPPFYELHVWAWRANHAGTFADMNMDVSCDAMAEPSKYVKMYEDVVR